MNILSNPSNRENINNKASVYLLTLETGFVTAALCAFIVFSAIKSANAYGDLFSGFGEYILGIFLILPLDLILSLAISQNLFAKASLQSVDNKRLRLIQFKIIFWISFLTYVVTAFLNGNFDWISNIFFVLLVLISWLFVWLVQRYNNRIK